MMTYDEIDHGIFIDGEYMPLVVKDIVDWMDVHLWSLYNHNDL